MSEINYGNLLSPAVTSIKPSGIRRFFGIAEKYPDAISLGVGEPDFDTPWHIRHAGIKSLENGHTHYSANKGMRELLVEISRYLERRFNLSYNPDTEVLATVGGSEAIDISLRALVSPGDEVLIPEPSFVAYVPCAILAGAKAVPIVTKAENKFKLTAEALKAAITPKTKALILPYPNNPTGGVMRYEDLVPIAEVLRDTNIIVLSDEIYAELTYSGKHVSIAELPGMWERTVLISGFSKAFAMTGWRLGYACAPAPIIEAMTKIHQYALMCSPTTAQYAGVTAMKNGVADAEEMAEVYDMRRRVILQGVRDIGLSCFEPEGAFYIFPDISSTGLSSDEFCDALIAAQKVAVVPGNAFGDCGEGFVRLCYAYSLDTINTAIERMGKFLQSIK